MANENDPGASTQQFQAYVESRSPATDRRSGAPLLIIALIVIAVVIAAVAFFVLR